MVRVKQWYNGYNYFAEPIYNPFDILKFITKNFRFENYWWQSGNPKFLIEILKTSNFYLPNLEDLIVGEETLNAFDIERIDIIALLWQTGYLTFDKIIEEGRLYYKMKIPNLEIKQSLNTLFLNYLVNNSEITSKELGTKKALKSGDVNLLLNVLKSLFSSIPYNNYVRNELHNYEGYYASIIYTFLSSLGYDTVAEDVTNKGRIDLTLTLSSHIYIFEFKVDTKEEAIKQIKERKYYEKYLSDSKNIYIIGINFDSVQMSYLILKFLQDS
ncbi:MAG: hypothetical protein B6229_04710 [Spirochaetaceae bacterium 4572_7]|nr:MAG: hypothetical protein B6229_04710 [Spirochaetaceae bacterium 4572_7]